MDNRFEESFNELGLIYENYFVKKVSGQKDLKDNGPGWRKGAANAMPGGQPNSYRKGEAASSGYVVSDEEAPDEVAEDPIILKIEEMQKEAEEHGQDFALLQLVTLKKFIEDSK